MVMVFLDGMMVKFFKDNGEWELKMDMAYGLGLMEATMKANGISVCSMVRENLFIPRALMMEILRIFVRKVVENKPSRMVIHLLGSTRTESQMERESTNGRMEPIMMVLLFKV